LPYLWDYFCEIGSGVQTGGAFTPLTWQDITAWQNLRGIELRYFEAKIILDMSYGFVETYHAAKAEVCHPPDGCLYLFAE